MSSELCDSLQRCRIKLEHRRFAASTTYPILKHSDLVRLARYGELVGDDNDGFRAFPRDWVATQEVDVLEHVLLGVCIQVGGRLVQEQEISGFCTHQGARNRDTLPL